MDLIPQATATLQEIMDYHQIRKMLCVYCHGCDRGDGPRMRSVYGEDSWDDHGSVYRGPGLDFAEWSNKTLAKTGMRVSHILGQSQINVTGNQAGAETYFQATICGKEENGEDTLTLMGGRYVDNLIRDKGKWKINKRICVRDWSITLDVKMDSLRYQDFVQGQLSGEDPSYEALGLVHPGFPPKGAA